ERHQRHQDLADKSKPSWALTTKKGALTPQKAYSIRQKYGFLEPKSETEKKEQRIQEYREGHYDERREMGKTNYPERLLWPHKLALNVTEEEKLIAVTAATTIERGGLLARIVMAVEKLTVQLATDG